MTSIRLDPVIIPNGLFVDPKAITRTIRNVFEAKSKDIKIDFKVTTQTWKNKPKFFIDRTGSNGFETKRAVGTNDMIYKFVNGGTRPHQIAPKNYPFLRFQTGFKAKTKPKVIPPGPGKKFGPKIKVYRPVSHPGTTARDFDKEIKKKWDQLLPKLVTRAILSEMP